MTDLELSKIASLLENNYSLHETDALCRWITDDKAPIEDMQILLAAISNDDVDFIVNY